MTNLKQEAPERISAGPCGKCHAMVVGLNACPYCGTDWIGARVEYVRADAADYNAALAELRATRQILAEYPDDEVLQIQARAIDKLLGEPE